MPSAAVAIGGSPAKANEAGTGGAGGYLMVAAGQAGTAPDRGGGGGGGGVGWIRINAIERETTGAVMSPAVQ
jgi:hypothetical protein